MIVFDYGNTLLCEPDWDLMRGVQGLLAYAEPAGEQLCLPALFSAFEKIFKDMGGIHHLGYELHAHQLLRLVCEYSGLELTISYARAETVFWDNLTPGALMPGADKMLDYINSRGIRSGVISNIALSGEALSIRLNRFLPQNRFEFVMASSDYAVCKPNRLLFETALKKAGLPAGEVWYCGDSLKADVGGASRVGIFPVWYDDRSVDEQPQSTKAEPECEHLHIHKWDELIAALEVL
jgi:putative hydrolase of the HAD superfamily